MKVLERVKVADLHTPRDSYGNEFPSREFDAQVNIDYVQELADSFNSSGEPDVALSLVRRDEGGYYVADGQSRLHAMQLRSTSECWGVIDEDATVQDVIETIMRTNKKKKYEPAEESRVVQQLAAFGDDAYVSEVASIDVDNARRVRKAREMIGEKAEQLSLDRLYAVSDFEGDEDAVSKIIEAPEGKWESIADNLKRVKRMAEQREAFVAEAAKLGIELVESWPGGGRKYICRCTSADDLEADYMAARVEHTDIVGQLSDNWYSIEVSFYGTALGSEEIPEEAEERRLGEEYREMAQRIDDACCNWVMELLGEPDARENIGALPTLDKACRKVALKRWDITDVLKMFPQAKNEKNCLVLFALGYKNLRKFLTTYASYMAKDEPSEIALERTRDALDWVELHIVDGWKPDEGMQQFIDMMHEKVDGCDQEPDEFADDYDEEDE